MGSSMLFSQPTLALDNHSFSKDGLKHGFSTSHQHWLSLEAGSGHPILHLLSRQAPLCYLYGNICTQIFVQ